MRHFPVHESMKFTGDVRVMKCLESGLVVFDETYHNTATGWAQAVIAQLLLTPPNEEATELQMSRPLYIALGTGQGSASPVDQTMFNETYGTRQPFSYTSSFQVYAAQFTVNYPSTSPSGSYWEAGLWDSDTSSTILGANVEAGATTLPLSSVLLPPVASTLSASTSGGSLASGTVYVVITAVNENGETTASAETSIAVTGPDASVTVTITEIQDATSYNVYVGSSSGGEILSGNTTSTSYTITSIPSSGTKPPTTNTATIPAPPAVLGSTQPGQYTTAYINDPTNPEYVSIAQTADAGASSWTIQSGLQYSHAANTPIVVFTGNLWAHIVFPAPVTQNIGAGAQSGETLTIQWTEYIQV